MEEHPWLIALVLSTFILILSALSTLADDSAVMKELAKAVSPAPPSWSGADPCSWDGVDCGPSNRVIGINLDSKSLSGTLPPDLNLLTELKSLSLQNNKFSGPLPSFANLSNLQTIFVDNNNFKSVPPSCFSGLTNLQTLSISMNLNLDPWFFPGELVQSQTLQDLDARNVSFLGTLPDIFESFASLQSLRLSYNNFTGPLPASLGGSLVKNLWLNNQVSGFSGGIDVLGRMEQLSQVWLQKNLFTGPIPDLSNCKQLFDLQLRDNLLTGVIPPSLTSHPSLRNVTLQNNMLQGPYPQFGTSVSTELTNNKFCNDKPGPCDPQVTTLLVIAGDLGYPANLADSWKGNDACQGWTFIGCDPQRKSVTSVGFSKQHYVGIISPAFGNLTSLTNLVLNDNNLSGTIPDSLTKLPQLRLLDLTNNNITGTLPKFSSLVTVKLDGNKFFGINTTTGGGGGGGKDGPAPSGGSTGTPPPGGSGGLKAAEIAGIIIAVVVFVGIVSLVSFKLFSRKQTTKFGRVPSTSDGKEMASVGSVSGHINGYGGVGNELISQNSDNSEVQSFQGGNVAISIQVLRQVTDNFSPKNILGRGGFGIVYKGVLHDGTQIAVKRMESSVMSGKGLKEFQAEIAVLTKVRHRHLVALLGFCTNDNERLLVYEYMPQGTLGQHLFEWRANGKSPLTWKQRITIALDVARGVEYLHTLAHESFIHRDLKASNILLGDDMRAKVSDFGLVKSAPNGKQSIETRLAGTFGYLAPEYAVTGKVTTKVDVFAFGAVLMELITGRPALDETRPDEQVHLVTWFRRVMINKDNIRNCIDPTLEPADETFGSISKVIELAGHCTSREAGQRPDMGHAVNILGPLVEQWTPSQGLEDISSNNIQQSSLPQVLEMWRASEGETSTMDYSGIMNFNYNNNNTQSSIPSHQNTFKSADGR